jgi:GntR family transcriptional regulator
MERDRLGLTPSERVAEDVKAQVRAGTLSPGEQLPGNRRLAELHGVALATLQKSLKSLEEQGWVVIRPTVGVFVASEIPTEESAQSLADQVAELRSTVSDLRDRVASLERSSGGGA